MERPDLGNEYGGWQAIDATPQETSEDVYRCGPSSLRAVRDGELQRPYDAAYVFAQVNADKVKSELWSYIKHVQYIVNFYTISIPKQVNQNDVQN